MKYYELKELIQFFKKFDQIKSIRRIDDNVICIGFDKKISIGFDMSRGRSELFWANDVPPVREYNAPFDSLIKKRFNGAKILNVTLVDDDKILRFDTALQKAYRLIKTSLQFEFTGRYTNAIILDENGVILEALRHIGSETSFRVIQPGVALKPLKPYNSRRQSGTIKDIEEYLKQKTIKRTKNRLHQLKTKYSRQLQKKLERLKSELKKIPCKSMLRKENKIYSTYGAIALANINKIKPYEKSLKTINFEGEQIEIELPALPNPKRIGEYFYNLSRRASNKLKNLHIEEENLKSKIKFYECMLDNLKSAKSEAQIVLLFPPKQQQYKKKSQNLQCEVFWIDQYKVLVGRNERENIWVLKQARANDLWLHLKDRPSSHCIIQNSNKKQIARSIIKKAARICVKTSTTQLGDYLVDFTYRRNVKIKQGAHVTYVNYDTIKIK